MVLTPNFLNLQIEMCENISQTLKVMFLNLPINSLKLMLRNSKFTHLLFSNLNSQTLHSQAQCSTNHKTELGKQFHPNQYMTYIHMTYHPTLSDLYQVNL